MRSAMSSAMASMWVVRRIVPPLAVWTRSRSLISRMVYGSRPTNGSSMNITDGLCKNVVA